MNDADGENLLAEDDVVVRDDPPAEQSRRMPIEGLEPGDEEFSRNTQKRIAKAFGRAKAAESAAERERARASDLERRLAALQQTALEATEGSVDRDLDTAKARYARAFSDADGEALTAANADMATLTARKLELQQARARVETPKPEGQQPQRPATSAATQAYIAENPWFETDPAARSAAIVAHRVASRRGIAVDTPEYFELVTKTVKAQFPEHFDDDAEPEPPPRRTATPPVAPAVRSTPGTPPARGRLPSLTSEEARTAERMGISLKDYAVSKAKLISEGKMK